MAKTPKVKKREVSIHSRAARRGASPPSKDLSTKAPVEETEYKPWLRSAQNAGIGKKRKIKIPSWKQTLRQHRALEFAERNKDRLEKKVTNSKIREKKIKARRTEWDELNEKIAGKEHKQETKTADAGDMAGKGGVKAMEGVEQPNLEQPLPIRVTESTLVAEPVEVGVEPAIQAMALAETTAEPEPAEVAAILPADDLDDVT